MKKAFLISAALTTVWVLLPPPALSHETVNTTVTFDREIARILKKKCIVCHSENNLGIPLTSYEQTRPWARSIEDEVLRRHMPPWRAVPGYGLFANDFALTSRELQFIVAWVEGNGPQNKTQRLIVNVSAVHTPVGERLKPDFDRWELGRPDLLASLAAQTIPPGRVDEVRRVVVDLGLTAERWIRKLEYKPSDRRVVRAAFFSVQETGQWIGSWTPWYGVTTLPEDAAFRVPAGAHVVADIYYRGADQPVEDRGTLGVHFAPAPAKYCPADLVLQSTANAAPHERHYATTTLLTDTTILAFKLESPPGARSVEVRARKPDGTIEVMLLVRDILPEWPTPYILKEPVRLPKGTELSLTSDSEAASNGTTESAGMKLIVSRFDVGATATAQ